MAPEHPIFTIVVCTSNRASSLDLCLESISGLHYSNFNVMVVDNTELGDLPTRAIAEKWKCGYIVEPKPSLSRARNTGARASAGEIIAYIDDDCLVDSRWLGALAAEFQDASIIAVTGQVSSPPAKDALRYDILGKRAIRFDRSHPLWLEMAYFGGVGTGGNMAFRRSAFKFWRGFDERIGRGCRIDGGEEHLAFAELIEGGYAVHYTPAAVVFHSTRESRETDQPRYLQDLRNSTAYVTLLLAEKKGKARLTVYVLEAFFGRKRSWRTNIDNRSCVSFWRRFAALSLGPMLYVKTRFRSSVMPRQASQATSGR